MGKYDRPANLKVAIAKMQAKIASVAKSIESSTTKATHKKGSRNS